MVFLISDWGVRAGHNAKVREDSAARAARLALENVRQVEPVAHGLKTAPPPPPVVLPQPAPTVLVPTVKKTILSYLYQQYNDDDDLQAFVDAFNTLAQEYVDWFNNVRIPVYTDLFGPLLDWVASYLYGYKRPVLPFGILKSLGPYNTAAFNTLAFNDFRHNVPIGEQAGYTAVNDDVYQRCLTWHFYKGDGKTITIKWLKRRVMRFLIGANGTAPNIDQTYRVSVSIVGDVVYIGLLNITTKFKRGAVFGRFAFNAETYNDYKITITQLTPLPMASVFKQCMDAGVLETPFQFTFVVYIEG